MNRQSAIANTNKPKPMFLQLNHQKLDVFAVAKAFTLECYRFTKLLASEERFNMIQQIRRAALSVKAANIQHAFKNVKLILLPIHD